MALTDLHVYDTTLRDGTQREGLSLSVDDKLAVAAHLSALDYFGEVPWTDYPPAAEWYLRMKSRPSFRSLLADRVPGQPPAMHYAELDF